jgi:cell wall-associated NlpC family hydrolase
VSAPSAKGKAPAAPAAAAAAAPAAGGRTTAPTPYTIVAGDYLYGIARRFAVPFNSLLTTNQLTATSAILPGRQLIIPAGATTTPAAPTATPNAAAPTTTAPATTTTAPKVAKPIAPPRLDIAATGNAQIDAVLAFAKAQLGKPYVFAAAGPDTYDCSGLTAAAYAQAGVTLIRQSGMQSTQGTPVDFLNTPIVAGDLVFTAGSATPGVISHVGIAINGTQWIQATRPGAWVSVGAIPAKSKILAVRRYIG